MCEREFVPSVDLFATRENLRLPSLVSLVPDPLALEVDAFPSVRVGGSLSTSHSGDAGLAKPGVISVSPQGNIESPPIPVLGPVPAGREQF